MKRFHVFAVAMLVMFLPVTAGAVPNEIAYSGTVEVQGSAFTGTGQFKFAILDSSGATVWSNDGTSSAGGQPLQGVSASVVGGIFNVVLGSTLVMNAISPDIFQNEGSIRLRVWFNDGSTGFEQLVPDVTITSVPYALVAETVLGVDVCDLLTTSSQISGSQITNNSITGS